MRFFRSLDRLMRTSRRVVDERPPQAPTASPDDSWADLRQRFAEPRVLHAEHMRKVDEARRRLRELARNPPREI